MSFNYKRFLPHLIVIILFIVAALAYFNPVLQGKAIMQSDIVQYTGMAKQQNDFRAKTGEETYWTNSAFGGMPTYQLGAKYPHNYIKKLDLAIRFLPRPADYLFLYFIGIYILFMVLKVDYKLAFLGALAFGFSTYLIIILGVGHNAKAHAIAYMPLVLSGIILTFQKRYLGGFLLTAIAMGLELAANHFQMTYYLGLLVICLGIAYLIDAYQKKELPHYFKSVGIMVGAVILALGLNATNLMATAEYAKESTRGKSELTINADGSPKASTGGLNYDYITEYSYGKLESLNLFIPRLMGGGTGDTFTEDSETINYILKNAKDNSEAGLMFQSASLYWGNQPIVAAPAYIGAVIIFLAVLALFLIRGRFKWWAVAGFLLSLLLSWGDNFAFLTKFFINNIPMYDKFRAVSSIQVLIELIVPVLAIVGLHQFFNKASDSEKKQKALKLATAIIGGLAILLVLGRYTLLDFSSPYDRAIIDYFGIPFVEAIREDRASVMMLDTFRSLLLVLLTAGALWMLLKNKLKENWVIAILGILIVVDLIGVDSRYVNAENFKSARLMEKPFQESPGDSQILKDDGYFRVYDATTDPFNSGRASYYHNALGGYHAAKPAKMQDIYNFYLDAGDINMLNMMNVKYILVPTKDGTVSAQQNPYANGPAWYVSNVLPANNSNEEILLLDSLDTKNTAVVNRMYLDKIPAKNIQRDSSATIDVVLHEPNHLQYKTDTDTPQLAVFSEIYYPHGWNAYIDGQQVDYFPVNYLLRGMVVPEGLHTIDFKFEPEVIQQGSTYSLLSAALLLLIALGAGYWQFRANSKES